MLGALAILHHENREVPADGRERIGEQREVVALNGRALPIRDHQQRVAGAHLAVN